MTGIRKTDNAGGRLPVGQVSAVHYLFSVGNMFSKAAGGTGPFSRIRWRSQRKTRWYPRQRP